MSGDSVLGILQGNHPDHGEHTIVGFVGHASAVLLDGPFNIHQTIAMGAGDLLGGFKMMLART